VDMTDLCWRDAGLHNQVIMQRNQLHYYLPRFHHCIDPGDGETLNDTGNRCRYIQTVYPVTQTDQRLLGLGHLGGHGSGLDLLSEFSFDLQAAGLGFIQGRSGYNHIILNGSALAL